MAQKSTQNSFYADELDLREIVKLILEYKKLIIVTILFFTIASIIYVFSLKPEFRSSTILEIGHFEEPDGTQKIIEKPSDLISYLNLYHILNHKDESQDTSFKVIENKLILIETTSSLAEQNENFLFEIFSIIDERHSNLAFLANNHQKIEIIRQIESIEAQFSFIKALELSEIENRLAMLTNELPIIDQELSQLEKIILADTNNLSLLKENRNLVKESTSSSSTLEQIIFNYKTQVTDLIRMKSLYILEIKSLNNKLKNDILQSDELFSLELEKEILEDELQMLMNQTQLNTRLIGNIETDTLIPKTLLIISLGIIIGFITSIFLVFISNILKSFREIKA